MAEDFREKAIDFERSRNQLMNVSAQKQQLQMQGSALGNAIEELEKTKEKKESIDLRVKTMQKQEDSLVNKLNKLKSEIETAQKAALNSAEDTVIETESGRPGKKK